MNGVASGLRSSACRITPDAASALPTSAAASTRGNRATKKICASTFVAHGTDQSNARATLMCVLPMSGATTMAAAAIASAPTLAAAILERMPSGPSTGFTASSDRRAAAPVSADITAVSSQSGRR